MPHPIVRQLRAAFESRDDAACANLVRACAAQGGLLLPVTFEDVAAADMAQSALAVAQAETAQCHQLCDAEATDSRGTYLHAAAAAGAGPHVVAALIAAGCHLDTHDDDGNTPLHCAAHSAHVATLKVLLAAGAHPLARNKTGRTARGQGGLTDEVRDLLMEAEQGARAGKAARQEVLWGSRVQKTQTESAYRTGCL